MLHSDCAGDAMLLTIDLDCVGLSVSQSVWASSDKKKNTSFSPWHFQDAASYECWRSCGGYLSGFEHRVCVISRWCLKVSRELPDSLQKSMFHHWDVAARWMCFGVSLQQKNALIQPPSVIHRSYTLTSHLAGWVGWLGIADIIGRLSPGVCFILYVCEKKRQLWLAAEVWNSHLLHFKTSWIW